MELPEKTPVCPYCNMKIHNATDVVMDTKIFYLCPKCSKVLSIENNR